MLPPGNRRQQKDPHGNRSGFPKPGWVGAIVDGLTKPIGGNQDDADQDSLDHPSRGEGRKIEDVNIQRMIHPAAMAFRQDSEIPRQGGPERNILERLISQHPIGRVRFPHAPPSVHGPLGHGF